MTMTENKVPTAAISVLLFVCALILRISYVYSMEIDFPFRADAGKYLRLALNLAFNHSYSLAEQAPFTPSTYISPGYPLFLAAVLRLTGEIPQFYSTVLLIQALLSSLTVLLTFHLVLRLTHVWAAFLGALWVAISPQLIIGSGYVLTETLSGFLIVLSVTVYLLGWDKRHWLWFALSGAMFACAALVRPAILLFPPLLCLASLLSKQQVKRHAALLVALVSVWAPWQIWQSDNRQPDEVNLAAAAFALGGYPDLTFKTPELRGYPYREDPQYEAMTKSLANAASVIWARALQQPWRYASWYLFGKPWQYWQAEEVAGAGGPYVYEVASSVYTRQPLPAFTLNMMMAIHPLLIALGGLACVGYLADWRARPSICANDPAALVCVALLAYFTALHSVLAPLPRYAFPVYPIAYGLAAAGAARLLVAAKAKWLP